MRTIGFVLVFSVLQVPSDICVLGSNSQGAELFVLEITLSECVVVSY